MLSTTVPCTHTTVKYEDDIQAVSYVFIIQIVLPWESKPLKTIEFWKIYCFAYVTPSKQLSQFDSAVWSEANMYRNYKHIIYVNIAPI